MSVDIEARVRRANPLTHDKQLDQLFGENTLDRFFLDVLAEQEGRMTDIKPDQQSTHAELPSQTTAPTKKPKLRLGVALTAFIVVIAVGVGLVYVQRTGVVASPIEISEDYITAIHAGDIETAYQLQAEETVDQSLEDMQGEADWLVAIGWEETLEECTEVGAGPPVEVHCTVTFANAWTNALGVGPYGQHYDLVIENGKIQSVVRNFDPGTRFSAQAWNVFTGWISANHSADFTVMYGDPYWTPEAIVLWKQYTDEFVAEQ